MALSPGTRLGPYEVIGPVGAGGMGEVYRARDTRLNRDVAIKVLPPAFARDPERAQRFDREAQAISRLSHPNICALFDIGQQDGSTFLVMELLQGETLSSRLEKGPLPLDAAIHTGVEIAAALDAAHRQGIVHRDLKPGNIMLTRTGVKLLDFGLAKWQSSSDPHGARTTVIDDRTTPGTVLGTLQYMAPEQLEGREIDARTDLFAAGVVLYEMATGRKAFDGRSQASLISAILKDQPPPIETLLPAAPASLARVIQACLAKDPDERWQNAGDLRQALAWAAKGHEAVGGTASARSGTRPAFWAAVGLLVGAAAMFVASRGSDGSTTTRTSPFRLQFDIAPADAVLGVSPDEISFGFRRPSRTALAFSPEGNAVVFGGQRGNAIELYVRRFDQSMATALPGTSGAEAPFFSPDGKWIGFWQAGKLRKSLVAGGSPVDICPTTRISGASWAENGTIVFAAQKLFRVRDVGAPPEEIAAPDAAANETQYQLPVVLPGGKFVAYTVTRGAPSLSDSRIVVRPLTGGPARTLIDDASDGRYVEATGHLVFARAGALFAVPFDPERAELTGGAVNVVDDVMHSVNARNDNLATNAAQFTFSKAGHLAYLAGGANPDAIGNLVWSDGTRAAPVGTFKGAFTKGRVSPDGKRLLVVTRGRERGLWVYDIASDTQTRVPFDGSITAAEWLSDKRIVFSGARKGLTNIYAVAADGSSGAERWTDVPSIQHVCAVSKDGQEVLFIQDWDIWVLTVSTRRTRLLFESSEQESSAAFSPDGHWITYESKSQAYVRPYPDLGARIAVGGQGSRHPRWSGDGRRFFYVTYKPSDVVITGVDVDTTRGFSTGQTRISWSAITTEYVGGTYIHPYDVTNDGHRILAIHLDAQVAAPARAINVVLNWFDELRARTQQGR